MPFDGTKNVMERKLKRARQSLLVARMNIKHEEDIIDYQIREINRIKRESYEQEIDLE